MKKKKYSMWSNIEFLVRSGWKLEREVVLVPILKEMFGLGQQLLELFLVPVILRAVEQKVSLEHLLWLIFIFTMALVAVTGITKYLASIGDRLEGRVRCDMMYKINEAVCTTSYANILDNDYWEKLKKAEHSTDYSVASTQLYEDAVKLMGAVAGFGIYLCLMSRVSVWLIFIVLLCNVAGYYLVPNTRRVNVWSYGLEKDTAEFTHTMGYVTRSIKNNEMGKDIRLFGLGGWLSELYDSAMEAYQKFVGKREKRYLVSDICSVLLTCLSSLLSYAGLLYITLTDGLSASEFFLMFTAISGFRGWLNTILYAGGEMHKKSLGMCHIRELFDAPEPFLLEGGKKFEKPLDGRYELRMENVTYTYPEAEKPLIDKMDLTIHSGEKLAIVGLNGAGKTTLVKLLCGFLDPQEGRILLNGQDIREFNRKEYYELFAAVFQEFSVLDVTLGANVAQTEKEKNREKVEHCLKLSGLWEAVEKLPDGPDTFVGKNMVENGIELSGGQTQRMLLARALYKNAPILVLDEPTAALDPIAENELYQKYTEFSAEKTSLFISHRLASTRFCDRIIFLENGRILEEGSHEELLKKQGAYAKLFEVQSRYYKEEEWDKMERESVTWQE